MKERHKRERALATSLVRLSISKIRNSEQAARATVSRRVGVPSTLT